MASALEERYIRVSLRCPPSPAGLLSLGVDAFCISSIGVVRTGRFGFQSALIACLIGEPVVNVVCCVGVLLDVGSALLLGWGTDRCGRGPSGVLEGVPVSFKGVRSCFQAGKAVKVRCPQPQPFCQCGCLCL